MAAKVLGRVATFDRLAELKAARWEEKAAAVRRELGLPTDAVVIGSIGRLNEQKGHRYLIEAAARVLPAAPRARVLVVGDGDLQGALHVYHRRHAGRRRGEHGKKRVPLGVHLLAVMGGQSGADQRVMVCQHPAVIVPPPGAAAAPSSPRCR